MIILKEDMTVDLRCKESHVGSADGWISNACVEGRDGDEHDSVHEG